MSRVLELQVRLEDRIAKLLQAELQIWASKHPQGEWCHFSCEWEPIKIFVDGELMLSSWQNDPI